MRRVIIIAAAGLALGLTACGGDDGDDSSSAREDQARQAVIDTIAAYDDRDFDTVCDLLDERGQKSIVTVAKTDTCPEAYKALFADERHFGGPGKPFTTFADTLQKYQVGDATLTDAGAEVALTAGPQGPATSFLVDQDGELKVSELFVTPDANTNPGQFEPGN
jgi:hypothetical protein